MVKRIINWIFWKLNKDSLWKLSDLGGDLSVGTLEDLCLRGYFKIGYKRSNSILIGEEE